MLVGLLGRNSPPPPLANEIITQGQEKRSPDLREFLVANKMEGPDFGFDQERGITNRGVQRNIENAANTEEVMGALGRGRNVNLIA